MTYNLITIPAGFSTQKSYIKWMATVEVDNGFGAPGATFHRQTPPLTGKVKEVVQPHSKGGVVKLNISVNYRLFKLVDGPMNQQFPEEVESEHVLVWVRMAIQLFEGSVGFRAVREIYDAPFTRLQTFARLMRGGAVQGPSRRRAAVCLRRSAVESQVRAWRPSSVSFQ
jgi:hypothetical protein